ncbi:hypothetical protein JavanS176_0011 [Streptococcus satellite phage Javan176]|uniref:hypothetical protein n=1 Tax=Streptococcus entericus TaxID=155680 RepID=UPI00036A9180|nr:hypothetical protein [Streptococcus entericus]QBX07772.1 hypothetical protein JavanS176_0011 [Streptococcus satellite phage Javan176]
MNELANQLEFDYSLVSQETSSKLRALSNQLDGIYQNYSVAVGEVLYQAQQELASYDGGTFQKWVESNRISKTKAYNYINTYRLVQNLDNPQEKEIFLSQPKSLQYEMSKPSALPEVNQAVFDGDITTHKAYKELERKLKLQEQITSDLTDENSRLKSATVEVKEVVKEIHPPDYSEALRLSKSYQERAEAAEGRNAFLESQLSQLSEQREKAQLLDDMDQVIKQGNLTEQQQSLASVKDTIEFLRKANRFLASFGGIEYLDIQKILLSNAQLKGEMQVLSHKLEELLRVVKNMLGQSEPDIIDGVFLDKESEG